MRILILTIMFAQSARALTCQEYEAAGHPYTLKSWKSDNNKCSAWRATTDACDFEDKVAAAWQRDCSKASPCAAENICNSNSPAGMKEPCTAWFKDPNATCLSEAGNWEQHWMRSCSDLRLASDLCSDKGPESLE